MGMAMSDENHELQNDVALFKKLMENEWGDKMGRTSLETLNLSKQNDEKDLPTTEDMKKKLNKHLQQQLIAKIKEVKRNPSVNAYTNLVCVTPVSLMVFNKRRGGESMKILVSDYTKRASHVQNDTVVKSLSSSEKK